MTRFWALLTAITGIASLGTVATFQMLGEVKAAQACNAGEAVIRFELARSIDTLLAIFGPVESACRGKIIAAVDAVNTLDIHAFIPSYTAFAVFAALFLSVGRLVPLALAAIVAALVACAADYVETLSLLAYTPDLSPSTEALATSANAAWIKFAALGLNGLCLAGLCFTSEARRPILGVLLCLPAIGVAMMAVDLKWIWLQSLGFFASWTPLLLMALRAAVLGRE
ncbi:MAG: hypothetical protein ABL973_18670 [Micropepsaceae bacterium]